MEITAIILAGGKSSRMGQDKGLVKLNNTPFISHVISAIKSAGIDNIIIIANNSDYDKFGFPVFSDIYKEKGPLGGIYTGLINSSTENNLILSCDIPFIAPTLLNHLLNQDLDSDIHVIQSENRLHPLIGIYKKQLADKIKNKILNHQLKVTDFIKKQDYKSIDLIDLFEMNPEKMVININTMEELKKYENGM